MELKKRLALGTYLCDPYLAEIRERFEVFKISQLLHGAPGAWSSPDELVRDCAGASVLVLEGDPLDAGVLRQLKQSGLDLIICTRGNPVNVDADACRELGIPLAYTPGRNAQSVAEHTVALMLAVSKHIQLAVRKLADGTYLDKPADDIYRVPPVKDVVWMNDALNVYEQIPLGSELYGKSLGILGFGAIGRKVAKIASAFEMEVRAYDPYCDEASIRQGGAACPGINGTLDSDFVSVHMPANESTRGIIDGTWFARMKPGCWFINTARASVVDQSALIEALRSGHLAGAALDVMWQEPCPANHPLLTMDNVLITPHIAGNTKDIETWQSRMVAEELDRYLKHLPPLRAR